ncbi:MAG: conjugal transfer protein TraG N-terminal domain-containing protein, partial [Nevskia sp.]|nr:conjugal transfer protein TraG N-terminal domain-containing protein [Nevskia sp.]
DLQWLLFAAMGFYIAFLPTATVIITDNLDPSQSSVVNNVPLGLAATAGFSNAVGQWLSQTSEAVFSLPDDMDYTTHGMLFGNKLVDATMRFEITDPRVAGNFASFWQQCVFYDLLLGKYTLTDLTTAPDLWAFIQTNTSVARAFSYQPASGSSTIEVCHTSANGDLNHDLQAEIPNVENLYGAQLVSAASRNAAIAEFGTAMPIAVQYFSTLSDSESQIISQAILANSMQRGISAWASQANAPAAAQDYALARAEAERRTTYEVMGQLAQKYLPIVQNILAAGIYAVFPLAFILMLMPGGHRAVLAYAKVLAWITLWPFLFAVIHLAMTVFSAIAANPAVTLANGTKVLSMANYTAFGQVMSDYSLFAGYLTVSIPIIAWMLVSGSGQILASAAQGILSGYEKTTSSAAGEATTGNLSLGNTSFGNAGWWAQNTAPSTQAGYTQVTGGDGILRKTAAGREFDSMPMSSLPVSMALERSVRGSIDQGASEATRAARSDSVAESQRVGSQLAELDQLNHQLSRDQGFRDSVNKSTAADFQRSYGETTAMLDKLREGTTLTRGQTAQLMFASDASLSGTAGIGTPAGSPISAGARAGVSVGGSYRSGDEATRQKVLDRAKELGYDTRFGTALATTLRAGSDVAGSYGGSDLQNYAQGVSSHLSREAASTSATTASIEKAKSFEEARQLSNTDGFGARIQLDDKFKNWLAEKLGDQNSALALIREGAPGNNPSAKAELSSRMREFASAYAEQIAGTVGPLSAAPVGAQGEAWIAGTERSGEATAENLRAEGASQLHSEAASDRLDGGSINSQSEAARSGGRATKDQLTQDLWKEQGIKGVEAVGTKLRIEHEESEAQKKSLTQQVMLEDLHLENPESPKPNK